MAAQSGMIILQGVSGRTYAKHVYFSDTANGFVNWDSGAGASATSDNQWTPPENVVIRDVVLAAATTKTLTQIVMNGQSSGDILLNSVYLASIAFRPPLAIPVAAGTKLQAIQLT